MVVTAKLGNAILTVATLSRQRDNGEHTKMARSDYLFNPKDLGALIRNYEPTIRDEVEGWDPERDFYLAVQMFHIPQKNTIN